MSLRNLCLAYILLFATMSVAQNVPQSSHVWVIAEENHSYEEVVGNSEMPYYNQLIQQYGLATQFYADQHSSLPALMWFVAGAPVTPNNSTTSCNHNDDNIVRELLKQGYSWRSYQINLPYTGFQGLYGGEDNSYYRRHNPLIDFTDVCPGTGQDLNIVPYAQMAADFAQGNTVNYAWVTPDVDEDAHNGTLQAADQWLQNNLPAILARPEFSPGGDGILFVVWDEGDIIAPDNRCSLTVQKGCGGRTPTLVIGPQVTPGYQSPIAYRSENVLKTVCVAMGLPTCPGAAKDAAPMADFFNATGSPTDSVVISSPVSGTAIAGAVNLIATASENQTVSQTQVWDNGVKLGVFSSQIDTIFNLAPGQHTTTVLDLDTSYKIIHLAAVTYTVQPTGNTSTVHVAVQARQPVPVSQVQVRGKNGKPTMLRPD